MTELPYRLLEPQKKEEPLPLRKELENITRELRQAEDIFNNVTDDALTEASIYRIKALLSYRDYLLRTAREEASQTSSEGEAAVSV